MSKTMSKNKNKSIFYECMQNRHKLAMLNMLHTNVLVVDEFADTIIQNLDTGSEDDRIVYEALTRLKVAIWPFIDGLAELKVYGR